MLDLSGGGRRLGYAMSGRRLFPPVPMGLERREERLVPCPVTGVRLATDQLKGGPDFRLGMPPGDDVEVSVSFA